MLWVSDWGANEVLRFDAAGHREVAARVASFPMCIEHLPDGRLLIVDSAGKRLLRRELDGTLAQHADFRRLSGLDAFGNDIVVDGRGAIYVNDIGFKFPGGEFRPGVIVLVARDGAVRKVADDLAFPNGMAVTPDNRTLIVAESYGCRLTAFDISQAASRVGESGRRSKTIPMGSAWMRRAAPGTPMSETSAAFAFVREDKFSIRSSSTEARSRACSAAPGARRCSSFARIGAVRRVGPRGHAGAR
jgi:sugar lactone lactonase YvrE